MGCNCIGALLTSTLLSGFLGSFFGSISNEAAANATENATENAAANATDSASNDGGVAEASVATTATFSTSTMTAPPLCSVLSADSVAEWLTVKEVTLPSALPSSGCGSFGIHISCWHTFYAASPETDLHAILYNDADKKAIVVLLDAQSEIVTTKEIGSEEVRGLQFDPSATHLVAFISGATNNYTTPSYFIKMRLPGLEVAWRKPISSPKVGLEKWTPDNSDSIALSHDRYVMHTAGQCQTGEWCAGHQGDILQVLDAETGEQIPGEAKDWSASHSCKQMIGYNPKSNTFLMANMGDYYPKALQFVGYKDRKHLGKKLEFKTWGNGGGKQGVTQGAIKGDPDGPGFAVVWSNGTEDGEPDKLYYAMVNANSSGVTWQVEPRKVFPASTGTQLGGNIAPLGRGRWLLAYSEHPTDVIKDYLKIYWDNWAIPEEMRDDGSRVAVVDSTGQVLSGPTDVSALGARFPVEMNHLVLRPQGIGWVATDGPGKTTARVALLRCRQ